jgi:hypothetical protein
MAAASTVQLYGKMTYEYGYVNQGGNRPNTDVAQTPGGTAVGVKGVEKLGGGLSAWFQCESSADVRGLNQDGLCTRNSGIGLKGAFGNLHFGRWDSPFKRGINMGTVGVQDTGLLGHSFVFAGGSAARMRPHPATGTAGSAVMSAGLIMKARTSAASRCWRPSPRAMLP